jgi:subtilisin family serine protease
MCRWSGTSFATPLVAGLIAGRMSVTGENAKEAAAALKSFAGNRSISGLGRTLLPSDACASTEVHKCGCPPKQHC